MGQKVNTLGFDGHRVYVTTTQICCYNLTATMDHTKKDDHDHSPIKLGISKTSVIL